MAPVVTLYDFVGLGLIVGYPNGVIYTNQTCGTACRQPQFEGVLVPLRNMCLMPSRELVSPENALYDYFTGPKWGGIGGPGIGDDDADFIDRLLDQHRLSACIAVDRSRLADSEEAWIHVQVIADEAAPFGMFSGFGPTRAAAS